MNIVIPMAGRGSRFKDVNIKTPKMLINVLGRPMLYWALDSLSKINYSKITFICLKEHIEDYQLDQIIYTYTKKARIIVINSPTNGQPETVYQARSKLYLDRPLLIYNCDTYTDVSIKQNLKIASSSYDGILYVFKSNDPSLSYVEVKDNGLVMNILEKKRISHYASTGLYYYANTRIFIDAVERVRGYLPTLEEMYVAHVYNYLIEKGYKFVTHKVKQCYPLGTPDQLNKFIQNYPYSKVKE